MVLILQQNGDTISGVSCEFESGQRIYSGAPVHGEFPRFELIIGAEHAEDGVSCPALE